MRLFVHCIHYPVCSGRYMVDAYRRLGHQVYHSGEFTGRRIWGMDVPAEYAWRPEPPPPDWTPDLAILMDTAYQWHYEGNAPTVVHSVDNHVRDLRQPGILHYFLAHRSVSVMAWGDTQYTNLLPVAPGFNEFPGKPYADMTHLPCAYDPHWFTPSPIAWEDREYDVCCLGFMYPQRRVLVEAFKRAGLRVLAGTGLVYDNYAAAYQNSRVSLCVSARGDLAIRVFETAAMGCAVLSDPLGDLQAFPNHPITEYRSIEEAVERARALQNQPEVGAACAAWAEGETWDARCRVILDWLEGRKS